MKTLNVIKAICLVTCLVLLNLSTAISQEIRVGDLLLETPTIRATPPNAPVSGGYLKITNNGSKADRLIGGAVSFAGKVEIHEMKMDGDVMQMRKIANGLEIPAGGEVILKPGGFHIMFMKLGEQMKVGEFRRVKLKFQHAGEVEIKFEVTPIKRKKMKMDHSKMDHSKMKHGAEENAHDHGKLLSLAKGPDAPTLDIELMKDKVGGWNLHIITANFRFAPEVVNQNHAVGEGHAHVYLNGEKLARVYGPWFHIATIPEGEVVVKVTLNANDHRALAIADMPLAVEKTIAQ